MVSIIRDSMELIRDLVAGIKYDIEWSRTQKEFENRAIEALTPIKDDVLYIAQVLRKNGVQGEDYSAKKSLQELVTLATPPEEEVERFSQSANNITSAFDRSDLPLGALIQITNVLEDLYFNPAYQLPKLL